jgi:Ca2+-binding EF-hand superfamily protein
MFLKFGLGALVAAAVCSCGVTSFAADAAKKERDPAKFFDKKDANGDGFLSLDEFKAGMPEKAAAKADQRFQKVDANGDGKVSRDELNAGMEKRGKRKKQ